MDPQQTPPPSESNQPNVPQTEQSPPQTPQQPTPQPQVIPPSNPITPPATPISPQETLNQTPASPRKSRRKIIVLASALVILVVIGLVVWLLLFQKPDPDKVFNGFLANTLTTKQFAQVSTSGSDSIAIKYDVSDVKNIKDSINLSSEISGTKFKIEGWGSFQNNYIKFVSFDDPAISGTNVIGKWVQLRKDGTNVDLTDTDLNRLADPRFLALGNVIFGDFKGSDKSTLADLLSNKKIYSYDSKKVTKDKIDGHEVFVYEIKENLDNLKNYNHAAGKIMGISDADIDSFTSDITGSPLDAKLFIRIDTKQLVKVDIVEDSGKTITNVYSDYGNVQVAAEPKPDITYDELNRTFHGN